MIRQAIFATDLILTIATLAHEFQNAPVSELVEVAKFDQFQPTGVAVSKTDRVVVNFPLWSVEQFAETVVTDDLWRDEGDNAYHTALEN